MRKPLLLGLAVLLFLFYNYCFWQWLQSGHGFKDVWRAIWSDWLLAVTALDMSIFSLLCLVWFWRDMRRQQWKLSSRLLLLIVTLLCGVVVLLAYLAFRPAQTPTAWQNKKL